MTDDCGRLGACAAKAPGCMRHFLERIAELRAEGERWMDAVSRQNEAPRSQALKDSAERVLTEDERRAYEAELLARPAKLVESKPKPPLFAWKSRSKSKVKPMPAPTTVAEPVSPEPVVPPAAERHQVEPDRHELVAHRRQVRRRRRRRAAPVDDLHARLDAWARESADRVVRRVLERAFGRAA